MQPDKPTSPRTFLKLAIVALLLALVSGLHLWLGPQDAVAQIFLQDLYFLPIVVAGFWFGLAGGLLASVVATAVYLPWLLFSPLLNSYMLAAAMTQVILFLGVAFLVGWLRRREQRYQRQAQKAGELAAVGQAVASVAHDMKTPLMAIGGFTAQVLRGLPGDGKEAKKLKVVVEQTARLEAMVKEMLDFSRPLEARLSPVDIGELARRCEKVVEPLAAKLEVSFHNRVDSNLPPAQADPDRLEQALINLLSNAIQACKPGGKVELSAEADGDDLWLEVSDDGPGVPPVEIERILEPFYTTKKEGTGLGLPTVIKIAKAHGGRLEIGKSALDGALFTLVLPHALNPAQSPEPVPSGTPA